MLICNGALWRLLKLITMIHLRFRQLNPFSFWTTSTIFICTCIILTFKHCHLRTKSIYPLLCYNTGLVLSTHVIQIKFQYGCWICDVKILFFCFFGGDSQIMGILFIFGNRGLFMIFLTEIRIQLFTINQIHFSFKQLSFCWDVIKIW